MTELCEIAKRCKTDKVDHGYTPIYHEKFKHLRDKKINLLEIGIYKGGSLKMWLEYFPKAHIYAIDNKRQCAHLGKFRNGRTTVFKADQSNRSELKNVLNSISIDFDIIIDDGMHYMKHQQVSLGMLFPRLKDSGFYVVEDLATMYNLTRGAFWGQKDDFSDVTSKILEKQPLHFPHMTYAECKLFEKVKIELFYPGKNKKGKLSTFSDNTYSWSGPMIAILTK